MQMAILMSRRVPDSLRWFIKRLADNTADVWFNRIKDRSARIPKIFFVNFILQRTLREKYLSYISFYYLLCS